jgi:hypothetical protein
MKALVFTTLATLIVSSSAAVVVDTVAVFRALSTSAPPTLVVSMTHTAENLNLAEDLTVTNGRTWSTIRQKQISFIRFIKEGPSFVVARSGVPLDRRFERGVGFFATAVGTNTAWSLGPSGQIHYDLDRIASLTNSSPSPAGRRVETAMPLECYRQVDVHRFLCLGIQATPGSLVWMGSMFKGTEETFGAPGAEPRQVAGSLLISNNLPVIVEYAIGDELWETIGYEYSKPLCISFPNRMHIQRFTREEAGTEQLRFVDTFEISEMRCSLTPEDYGHFDPHYFVDRPLDYSGFSPDDFINVSRLAAVLKAPGTNDGVSHYIREQLSGGTLALLASYTGRPSPVLKEALLEDFNRIIRSGPIYDLARFSSVKLSSNTASLLERRASGSNQVALNQMLLMDAYRGRISKTARPPMEFAQRSGKSVAARYSDGTWHTKKERAGMKVRPLLQVLLVVFLFLPAAFAWRQRARRPKKQ